jgi:hypothetical protein
VAYEPAFGLAHGEEAEGCEPDAENYSAKLAAETPFLDMQSFFSKYNLCHYLKVKLEPIQTV